MAKGAGKARKKLPKELAVVNADNCTGCEACIEVCPVDCIYKVAGRGSADAADLRRHRPGALHRLRAVRALVPVGRDRHGQADDDRRRRRREGRPPEYVAAKQDEAQRRRAVDPKMALEAAAAAPAKK